MYYVVCMGGASCKTLVEQFTTLPDIISQEMNLFDVINAFAVLHFAIISKLCWHTPELDVESSTLLSTLKIYIWES